MQLAKAVSQLSDYKIKMGAVIIKRGRLMGVGHNVNKTHPKSAKYAATVHAEHSAIIATNGANLDGSTVLVYRENKAGEPVLAKPCHNCTKLLRDAGCKEVVYTVNEYPYFVVEKL